MPIESRGTVSVSPQQGSPSGPFPKPTQIFLDEFNRTNGVPGNEWTGPSQFALADEKLVATQTGGETTNTRLIRPQPTNTQKLRDDVLTVKVPAGGFPASGTTTLGVIVRGQVDNSCVEVSITTAGLEVQARNGGGTGFAMSGLIAKPSGFSLADGFQLKIAAEGETTTRAYCEVVDVNGARIDTGWGATGEFGPFVTAGAVGLSIYGGGGPVTVESFEWSTVHNPDGFLRVGVMGDSTSAGAGGGPAITSYLQTELEELTGRPCVVTNTAISGTYTGQWLPGSANYNTALAALVAAKVTDVHLCFINDRNINASARYTVAQVLSNWLDIAEALIANGIERVYLSGGICPNVPQSGFDEYSLILGRQIAASLETICNGTTILRGEVEALARFWADASLLADNIHANAAGQAEWAKYVARAMVAHRRRLGLE